MAVSESVVNADVLNSWKEVATYMGRGVRTVQRWEQELGLPVRRPRGKSRSAVIALKNELDRWLKETPQEQGLEPAADKIVIDQKISIIEERLALIRKPILTLHPSNATRTSDRTHKLLERSHNLCKQSVLLCEQVHRTATRTAQLVGRQTAIVTRTTDEQVKDPLTPSVALAS
ncbi:MAG TPA: hypothetical protein VFB79_08035 [Candidatus Angelobacter sp.]|nr:hypothetical protein [Candidatus Angelobacter sp.]